MPHWRARLRGAVAGTGIVLLVALTIAAIFAAPFLSLGAVLTVAFLGPWGLLGVAVLAAPYGILLLGGVGGFMAFLRDDPMHRRSGLLKCARIFGTGVLLVLPPLAQPVRSIGTRLFDAGFCTPEHIVAESHAPRGSFVLRVVQESCGGAVGSGSEELTVRRGWDILNLYGDTLCHFQQYPSVLRFTWQGEVSVIVEHDGTIRGVPKSSWEGLLLEYRQLPD
jgi:hypothetical protein